MRCNNNNNKSTKGRICLHKASSRLSFLLLFQQNSSKLSTVFGFRYAAVTVRAAMEVYQRQNYWNKSTIPDQTAETDSFTQNKFLHKKSDFCQILSTHSSLSLSLSCFGWLKTLETLTNDVWFTGFNRICLDFIVLHSLEKKENLAEPNRTKFHFQVKSKEVYFKFLFSC